MRTQKSKELRLTLFQEKKKGSKLKSMSNELSRCLDLGKIMAWVTVDVNLDGDDMLRSIRKRRVSKRKQLQPSYNAGGHHRFFGSTESATTIMTIAMRAWPVRRVHAG